tara:strand:+ start:1590 stop:1841 length:252 start_codon:yes stop_codon:yes gene_type:complete
MGFHKRHINNDQIISLYKAGGFNVINDLYTKGVDCIIAETGLATEVGFVFSNDKSNIISVLNKEKQVIKLIEYHLVSHIGKIV